MIITRSKLNEILDGIVDNYERHYSCSRGCCTMSGCHYCGMKERDTEHKPGCLTLYARELRCEPEDHQIDNEN